ncbi:hypothetical protein BE04_07580 [Sorangium cellulosum]|uniref:Uncharacterized protein n=2 Tax=Sorangium cellulosum TaxID=56 RepID=A0A150PLD9_SORCE|nr:hypothetical protein [Sorangium cellulosum]AGP37897.1 hypothetical protein SCE1572_27555 [Sorangium cellulosum So0157-2]KYF56450.1 hypothetical protein BE04_07580 [Sorangium cellulosum]
MTTHYRRPDVRQEEDLLPWRRILAVAFAVVVIFFILGVWSWVLLRGREAELRPAGRSLARAREGFEPRGVVAGVDQRVFQRETVGEEGFGKMLNRRKREELGRFGWADRGRGIVQIPIEDAMNLVVEESR